jgi:hypothetical protein
MALAVMFYAAVSARAQNVSPDGTRNVPPAAGAEWQRSVMGDGKSLSFDALALALDGGLLAVGSIGPSDLSFDNENGMRVVRTDPQGTVLWDRTIDFKRRGETARFAAIGSDGHAIVAGASTWKDPAFTYWYGFHNAPFVTRFDSAGKTVWSGIYPRAGDGIALAFRDTGDGGLLVVGVSDALDDGPPACPGLCAMEPDRAGSPGEVACLDAETSGRDWDLRVVPHGGRVHCSRTADALRRQ